VILLVEPNEIQMLLFPQGLMRTTDAKGARMDSEMFWRVCPELVRLSLRFHVIFRPNLTTPTV
jgi:hypothetical protein